MILRLATLNFSSKTAYFDCKICLAKRKIIVFPAQIPPPQQVYFLSRSSSRCFERSTTDIINAFRSIIFFASSE
jgi:hypothetical protein